MKTLPSSAFLAALVAFLVLPVSPAIAGSILFVAGILSILVADYRSGIRAYTMLGASPALVRRTELYGLAA
jgi:hypothetical protein